MQELLDFGGGLKVGSPELFTPSEYGPAPGAALLTKDHDEDRSGGVKKQAMMTDRWRRQVTDLKLVFCSSIIMPG